MSEFFEYYLAADVAKKDEKKKKLVDELLPKNLGYVEEKLKTNNTGFIVGDSMTMVDVMLTVFVDNLDFVKLEFPLDKFPNVKACVEKVKSNKGIAAWQKAHQ